MAKRAKGKKRTKLSSKKTKSSPSKNSTRSSKKRSAARSPAAKRLGGGGRPATPFGIGLIASILFQNTAFQQAFEHGLGQQPTHWNFQEGLGYTAASYANALRALNGDAQVHLIVAVGGSIAEHHAGGGRPQKDTISLGGGRIAGAPNPGGRFRNRISLECIPTNRDRIAHLRSLDHAPTAICLLSNNHSKMTNEERAGFGNRFEPVSLDAGTINVRQVYTTAFNNIASRGFTAVIVSADPWFKRTSNELVRAANVWATGTRRVCYPLQEYQNDGPNQGRTTLHGPSLIDAYDRVGQLAAHVLDPATHPNPPQQPPQIRRDI